jgi:hypothetical protein
MRRCNHQSDECGEQREGHHARLGQTGQPLQQLHLEASRRRDTEIAMLCMLSSLKQKVAMLKPLSPNGWASRPSQ